MPKKPKSKPATKKSAAKAATKPQSLTPGPDRRLIDGIAARVKKLESELKAMNKKLDYRLGPRPGNGEEFEN